MAFLADPRLRAFDASGTPLSGATLTIYNANTTTLTSVYSDAALTTPLTNPVTADSAGRFPQIFAAEGTTVDMTLKTSAGVTVVTYEDAVFVGDDSGDFERTVTGSARIKITGTAGTVLIQAGDPSPDDTGGTLVIEGWAGTQLTLLTLDGATVNISGRITEQGKKIDGTVYYDNQSWTAASSVTIPLPEDPTNCRAYQIDLWDITTSTNSALRARLAYDGVPTFRTGATDYAWGVIQNTSAGTIAGTESAGSDYIHLGPALKVLANKPHILRLHLVCPDSGSDATVFEYNLSGWMDATSAPGRATGMGAGISGSGRPTHLQIYPTAGTFTGKYRVRPLRGFGD